MNNCNDIRLPEQNSFEFAYYIRKYWFAVLCMLVILFKYFLIQSVPLIAHIGNIHDHRMMVDIADNILRGNWLGETYINRHLAKGCGYPVLIALQNMLGLTLHQFAWFLYSAGCLLMTFALKPIVKNRFIQFLILTFLLLYPDFDMNMVEVYRFWVQGWHLLFIYSSITAIFLRQNKIKSVLFWSIPGIFGTLFYWHSFENSFWLIILYAATAVIIGIYSLTCKEKVSCCVKRTAIILSPLVMVAFTSHLISLANYHHYGFYGTTIVSSSNFPRLIKAIYSIKPASEQYNLSIPVPREVMERVYNVSPTLNKYKTALSADMDPWSIHGRFPNDNEIEGGWFYWSILRYFEKMNFAEQDRIFRQSAKEIEKALENGILEKRSIMPNMIVPPWRDEFSSALLQITPEFISRIKNASDLNMLTVYPTFLETKNDEPVLREITKFSTVYRDTIWINKHTTPLRTFYLKAERHLANFWMRCNPFFFYLTVFCLITQLILACAGRKKEIWYLSFIPLSVLGGMSVLMFGFIYIHISSFDTFGYLYPARQLMQMLTVVSAAVLAYSILGEKGCNILQLCKNNSGKNLLKMPVFYGILFSCIAASAGCYGISRILNVKTPYIFKDCQPTQENETEAVIMNNEHWQNGSNRHANILLLRNTPKNMMLLQKYNMFSLGDRSIRITKYANTGLYLHMHYEGNHLNLKQGTNRIFFLKRFVPDMGR